MSSIGFAGWDDSINADTEAVAAGVAAALAATSSAQEESRGFLESGAAAPGEVTGPSGDPPDSDAGGPDASDV
jgi:hypothetical protein